MQEDDDDDAHAHGGGDDGDRSDQAYLSRCTQQVQDIQQGEVGKVQVACQAPRVHLDMDNQELVGRQMMVDALQGK